MSECILAPGQPVKGGYRRIAHKGKKELAHRVAYCRANGLDIKDIEGATVLHKCDNPACWNAEHLSLGTQTDNMVDMYAKGRGPKGRAGRLPCADAVRIREAAKPYTLGYNRGVVHQIRSMQTHKDC